MDWGGSWYQTIAVLAFIISAGTAWEFMKVRNHLHMEELTPSKKWKKAISGQRHIPKHTPINMSEHGDEDDLRFYRDFSGVADYLNKLYEDEPWSFENTGKADIASLGSENGTEFEIQIRYNQQITGWIKLSCIHYRKVDPYNIMAELNLLNGRFFASHSVFGLAQSLSQVVSEPEQFQEDKFNILAAMTDSMWRVGERAIGNPDLEITFRGKAEWFLKNRRDDTQSDG